MRLPLMLYRLASLSLCLLVISCSKQAPPPPAVAAATVATPAAAPAEPQWVDEEPSEEVLRDLSFRRYAAIEAQGGIPLTSTNTGRSIVLRPKLYEVHKDSCKRQPQTPPGKWECGMTNMVSLAPDGSDPSEQGDRMSVKRMPNGEWVQDQD